MNNALHKVRIFLKTQDGKELKVHGYISNSLLTEHEGLTLLIIKPASGHIHELLCDRGHIPTYMTVIKTNAV